jgi:hypothetical protein
MKPVATLLAVLYALLLAGGPASAHSPYFTRTERITLPNGQAGELRLLHGDGIFFADPIRVLVLDAEGRLLARSHRTVPVALSCKPDHQCQVFDLAEDNVLELDPSTFRLGSVVPGPKEDRDLLGELSREMKAGAFAFARRACWSAWREIWPWHARASSTSRF